MKKLFLLLFVLPVLLACDNHIEQRTTVSDYEKERIRQTLMCHMVFRGVFSLYDFEIINTRFENWEFYEQRKTCEETRQRFTNRVFSVRVVNACFSAAPSDYRIFHLNNRFELLWPFLFSLSCDGDDTLYH